MLLSAAAGRAQSGTWSKDASGNWSDTNNWAGGVVAKGAGNTADFTTLNILAHRTVTLDSDRTIGIVQFRDTSDRQLWTLSGSSVLTLDNGTNMPKARATAHTTYFSVVLAGTNGVAAPDQVGTAVFLAGNTYTGQTAIYRGTLQVAHANALPGGTRAGDVVMYTGGNPGNFPQLDLGELSITINGLSSAVSNTTSTALPRVTSLSGIAGTTTLTLGDNNASGVYQGTIVDGGTRAVALKKIGAGTQILNGANSYSGGTTVSGGMLVLNGANSGTGAVVANGGGMLAGSGSIAAPVGVGYGGAISPGIAAGTITLSGGLIIGGGGGAYVWDLAANSTNSPGVSFDQIILTGGNLRLEPSRLCIRFTGTATAPDTANVFWQSARSWKIISLSGGVNPAKANFGLIENGDYAAGRFTTAVDEGGSIVLTFTPGGPATNVVDFAAVNGRAFPAGVRGQNPYRTASSAGDAAMFNMSGPSLMRGPAGGLDADAYDWRVYNSGSKWGTPAGASLITTLDFLRQCRDTGSTPLFTANMFGGGYTNGYGTWVCQFDNHTNLFNPGGYGTNAVTGTAAQMAADWVRFCNVLAQTYRQGQESLIGNDTSFSAADNTENLRVYNSVKLGGDWGGRDVLLAQGEAAVPRVIWWEVGNEPEVNLAAESTLVTEHVITDKILFRDRYRIIANAMKAVDSSIQTGPCLTVGNNNEWLGRVAEDTNAPLDFVSVHPYMSALKFSFPIPTNMTTSLLDIGRSLADHISATVLTLSNYGGATRFGTKPADWYWTTPLIASEYNPVNWDSGSAIKRSMANGFAVVETCFRLAHPNQAWRAYPSWFGGNYWEQPQGYVVLTNAFASVRDFAGDMVLENSLPGPQPVPDFAPQGWPLRMYVTLQTNRANRIHVWGLNFSESQDQTVNFSFANLPFNVGQVIRRSFGKPGAENSLTNGTSLGWSVQDLTGNLDPSDFAFTVENASFAILTFHEAVPVNWMETVSLSASVQGVGAGLSPSLTLSGSNGITGQPYYVLTSTNLALALANWSRLLTNSVGTGGVISNIVPLDAAEHARFFRLQQAN
ncbi:MAG TPA: autotransporter-associated beta strand repeat-containing protein [Verrucomicrobiota bacterium]|nr:autotransporter-associated beta strand repeat-containing protein [Verrucomicrobiota bacterium]